MSSFVILQKKRRHNTYSMWIYQVEGESGLKRDVQQQQKPAFL